MKFLGGMKGILAIVQYNTCDIYNYSRKAHEIYCTQKYYTFLRRKTMNLDDLIITCFVQIDEMMPTVTKGKRLRERGPLPKLAVKASEEQRNGKQR